MSPERKDAREPVHRTGLAPVVGRSPKVLILGTIPSVLSDQKQQYYGNPQNQFWKIVHAIFDMEPSSSYQERSSFLVEGQIALWDVLHECDIDQSKDHSITDPVANDIAAFLRTNPGITHVFLNGQKALELFEELILDVLPPELSRPVLVVLPSTSTANSVKLSSKIESWKVIRMVLEG